MLHRKKLVLATIVVVLSFVLMGEALGVDFSIPRPSLGSWVKFEVITTSEGKEMPPSEMKYSIVDEIEKEGVTYLRLEMEMSGPALRMTASEGAEKPEGPVILQILLKWDENRFAASWSDFFGMAEELVISSPGQEAAILFPKEMLGMAQEIGKGLGVSSLGFGTSGDIGKSFQQTGREKLNVAGKSLLCDIYEGETKGQLEIMGIKFNTTSQVKLWWNKDIPIIPVAKSISDTLVETEDEEGKQESKMSSEMEVIDFGTSGAKTAITGEIIDFAQMMQLMFEGMAEEEQSSEE